MTLAVTFASAPTSLDEAWCTLARIAPIPITEQVRLGDADGRILCAPVHALRAAPPAAVSAMDGYAVCDEAPTWTIVGRSFAGNGFTGRLGRGECVRVFTGARVPFNADRVIPQENVALEGEKVRAACGVSGKRHIRGAGSDFTRGDVIALAGVRLNPQRLVSIAAADVSDVSVYARPRVSIIATGDELVEPGKAGDSLDATPDSLSFGVAALARRWGAVIVRQERLGDCLSAAHACADSVLNQSDIVVVIGGASVGERDYAKAMFQHAGLSIDVGSVAIRPGKPVWFGRAGGRVIVGLPGNPAAAMITARLFLAPLLVAASGGVFADGIAWRCAPVASDVAPGGMRETLLRAQINAEGVAPFEDQESSSQAALGMVDVLVRRSPGAPAILAGAPADVLDF